MIDGGALARKVPEVRLASSPVAVQPVARSRAGWRPHDSRLHVGGSVSVNQFDWSRQWSFIMRSQSAFGGPFALSGFALRILRLLWAEMGALLTSQ